MSPTRSIALNNESAPVESTDNTRYAYHNEAGEIAYYGYYGGSSGARFYETADTREPLPSDTQLVLYRLPAILAVDRSELIILAMHEADADTLIECGVFASVPPAQWTRAAGIVHDVLHGRDLIVLTRHAFPWTAYAHTTITALHGTAHITRVDIPEEYESVADWFAAGYGPRDIFAMAEDVEREETANQEEEQTGDTLPAIYTADTQLRDLSDAAIRALQDANQHDLRLFVRNGELVTVARDDSGSASIKTLTQDALRGMMARSANFYASESRPGKEPRSVTPPLDMVRDVFSLGVWPFPQLTSVTTVPVIRPDGTVLDTPGYDPATRLYYINTANVDPVPDHPTRDDIQTAIATIEDVISEFPFVGNADHANTYATMLTPFIRSLVECSPLAVFEAPKQGNGKSLLAEVISRIQAGSGAKMTPVPTTEEEWTKTLASLLREGAQVIAFDNATGTLDSATLALVLTSRIFKPRLLTTMSAPEYVNNATWLLTANNVRLGDDFSTRRCYPVRIDAKVEDPASRSDFRHPDLRSYILTARGNVIHALLVLARAWFAAGRPAPERRVVMGSFEQWAEIVSGILSYADVTGFLANRRDLATRSDTENLRWRGFLETWESLFGDNAITAAAAADKSSELKEFLTDRLAMALAQKPATFSRALGNALADQVDRRYSGDGLRIERGGVEHKIQLWRVVRDKHNGTDRARQDEIDRGVSMDQNSKPPANPHPNPHATEPGFSGDSEALGGLGGFISTSTRMENQISSIWDTAGNKPPKPPNPPTSQYDVSLRGHADHPDIPDTDTIPPQWREGMQGRPDTKTPCPECGHTRWGNDRETGEMVCFYCEPDKNALPWREAN